MAFDITNFGRISSSKSTQIQTVYGYTSAADNLAAISVSAYFDDLIALATATAIQVNDVFLITGTDGVTFRKITAISPNVTVAALDA
ncbi:unnamed protein product [marine sediment metagenome]|uniref:Uncharacterized protein n=1 Tax=marine sediment metagenome TaxID=412755 RepID=X0VFQ6_9ZZZZ